MKSVPDTAMELVTGMGEVWSAQTMCAYLQKKGVRILPQLLLASTIVVMHYSTQGIEQSSTPAEQATAAAHSMKAGISAAIASLIRCLSWQFPAVWMDCRTTLYVEDGGTHGLGEKGARCLPPYAYPGTAVLRGCTGVGLLILAGILTSAYRGSNMLVRPMMGKTAEVCSYTHPCCYFRD